MVLGVKNIQSILNQGIPEPEPLGSNVGFEGYWVSAGSAPINVSEKVSTVEGEVGWAAGRAYIESDFISKLFFQYILTETVKKNLKDLVRVVSFSNHPVLLQGDTSVGKTSLISYLASASGNKCLRINNHEHTDLQEYVGAYSADSETGQLVFKEG